MSVGESGVGFCGLGCRAWRAGLRARHGEKNSGLMLIADSKCTLSMQWVDEVQN